MNDLLIERKTENRFEFSLNAGEKISDSKPLLQTVGTKCNFRTLNGSSIVKKQNVDVTEITVRDTFGATGDFTFTTVAALWIKLIELNFFDGVSGGGSIGGSTTFTGLNDTFQFFGNNGKIPIVNEAEAKLEPSVFYNFNKFTQLGDVAISTLISGKFVSVQLINNVPKIVLSDPPVTIDNIGQSAMGNAIYADLITQTTPLNYTSGILQLTNDIQGAGTNLGEMPFGILEVWDELNGGLSLSELSIGDFVEVRVDISVTTTIVNQKIGVFVKLNEGLVDEKIVNINSKAIAKDIGLNSFTGSVPILVSNQSIKDLKHKIYFESDASASISVNTFEMLIIRKSINIIDFGVDADDIDMDVQGNGTDTSFSLPKIYDKLILFQSGGYLAPNVGYTVNGNIITLIGDSGLGIIKITGIGFMVENAQIREFSDDNIIRYIESTDSTIGTAVANFNTVAGFTVTKNEIIRVRIATGDIYEFVGKGKGVYGLNNLQVVEADFEVIFRVANASKAFSEVRTIIGETNEILPSDTLKIVFSVNPIQIVDLNLKTQVNGNFSNQHFTKLVGNEFGFSITPEVGVTVNTDLTLTNGKYFINPNQSFDLIKLGTDLWYLGSGITQAQSGIVTTAVGITNTTLTDTGSEQNGKVIGIANGVNVINYNVSGAITASFILLGTGAVTFIQAAGRTLVLKNATATLTGTGSTASIVSFGTVDYLYINNI